MMTRTFLAWDLVGSTRAWEAAPDHARASVASWVEVARSAVTAHGGNLFKLVGDGGWAEFQSASAAVEAARALHAGMTPAVLAARVALYSGEAERAAGRRLARCAAEPVRPAPVARASGPGPGGGEHGPAVDGWGSAYASSACTTFGMSSNRSSSTSCSSTGSPASSLPCAATCVTWRCRRTRGRLIGRDDELRHVRRLLDDHRLVTLAGVGGTGKTRLAIEAARDVSDGFELTAFVDLGRDRPARADRARRAGRGGGGGPGRDAGRRGARRRHRATPGPVGAGQRRAPPGRRGRPVRRPARRLCRGPPVGDRPRAARRRRRTRMACAVTRSAGRRRRAVP